MRLSIMVLTVAVLAGPESVSAQRGLGDTKRNGPISVTSRRGTNLCAELVVTNSSSDSYYVTIDYNYDGLLPNNVYGTVKGTFSSRTLVSFIPLKPRLQVESTDPSQFLSCRLAYTFFFAISEMENISQRDRSYQDGLRQKQLAVEREREQRRLDEIERQEQSKRAQRDLKAAQAKAAQERLTALQQAHPRCIIRDQSDLPACLQAEARIKAEDNARLRQEETDRKNRQQAARDAAEIDAQNREIEAQQRSSNGDACRAAAASAQPPPQRPYPAGANAATKASMDRQYASAFAQWRQRQDMLNAQCAADRARRVR